MAQVRCPVCGAKHQTAPHQCRLCGAVMDDQYGMQQSSVAARPIEKKNKGVVGFALWGIGIVVAILLAAVVFGFTTGSTSLSALLSHIPMFEHQGDGWVKVTDSDGNYAVEMPGTRQPSTIAFPAVPAGSMNGWTASIGPETDLSVYSGVITPNPDETSLAALNRIVDVIVFANNIDAKTEYRASLATKADTTFLGYPAVKFEVKGVNVNGTRGSEKAIIFLRGDRLYFLASKSIYPDQPQFDRFANSFNFTA